MNNARQTSGFSNRIQPLSERQAQIMEMIRQQEFIGVTELANHFDLAEQTIRRDLNSLCERGMARRVRGGIQRLNMTGNTAYAWRQVLNHDEKQAIALEVARQIIRQNSREIFLVLDHSKFNRRAHVRGGHIQEASRVFCDRTPPPAICKMIHKSGARLFVCHRDTL